MSMNVNNMKGQGGTDFGDPALGQHYARLIGFCYVGVHDRREWKGQAKDPCGKLLFTFELLDETVEIDGEPRPRWITKRENAFSTSNANAVKIYSNLDPSNQYNGNFDQLTLATVPCMLTVSQKTDQKNNPIEGTYVDASSITQVPKDPNTGQAYNLAAVQNSPFVFDFDEPTAEGYAALKEWMRQDVKKANDFPGSACERIAQAHDAQAAAAEQAAPAGQQPPVTQTPAPIQGSQAASTAVQPQPTNVAGVNQPAPVGGPAPGVQQTIPDAPPGYRYDPATRTFVPDAGAAHQPNTPPPAGGNPY